MCGRVYLDNDIDDILEYYGIVSIKNKVDVKGEIYPGTNIPVVLKDKTMDFYRWGFTIRGLNKEVINARIETVGEKPAFRKAFFKNRCIIPANAFFEWETCGKNKIKYKISVENSHLFSLAGIYDRFIDKNNNPYFGIAILTRPSNEYMSKLHPRMPVFIRRDEEEEWISGTSEDMTQIQKRLEMSDWMKLHIEPAEERGQISLLAMEFKRS